MQEETTTAKPMVIGLSGLVCAGKSCLAGFLEETAVPVSIGAFFLRKLANTEGKLTRGALDEFAAQYWKAHGLDHVMSEIMADRSLDDVVVVESVRTSPVARWLENWSNGRYLGVYIHAPLRVRMSRLSHRSKPSLSVAQLEAYDEWLLERGLAKVLAWHVDLAITNAASREKFRDEALRGLEEYLR